MNNNENTSEQMRTQSIGAQTLHVIGRHLEAGDGLKNILYSIARTVNEEHWALEDLLIRLRQQWSESCERYQTQADDLTNQLQVQAKGHVACLDLLAQIYQATGGSLNDGNYNPMTDTVPAVNEALATKTSKEKK